MLYLPHLRPQIGLVHQFLGRGSEDPKKLFRHLGSHNDLAITQSSHTAGHGEVQAIPESARLP